MGDGGEVPPGGWVFLEPGAVPERWAERAIPVMLVPLTPEESAQMLNGQPVDAGALAPDADLMRLVARGLSAEVIARRLGLAARSVYRRLARLREIFGVGSTAELAAELARRGFGVSDPAPSGTGTNQLQSNLEEKGEAS